jgi:adenylate cyclase
MAALYVVAAWLIMQVAEVIIGLANLPEWIGPIILALLAIGFPIALVVSWFYELTPEGVSADQGADAPIRYGPTGRMNVIIIALLSAGILLFAWDKWWTDLPEERSIAVLPFVNMSSDPEQDYFSDGISEELLNLLARVHQLRVVSRSSSFAYRGKDVNIPEVGKALNVAYVLEGSVRKAGNRICITAQLIEAATDKHLWSETFDRDLVDIFAIQDEVSAQIIDQLKIELTGEAPHAYRTDTETYALFLRAKARLMEIGLYGDPEAVRIMDEVVASDPDYVPALMYLATVIYYEKNNHGDQAVYPGEEGERKRKELVDRALAIDPNNAHAITQKAWNVFHESHDIRGAARMFERALENNASDGLVLRPTMFFASYIGDFESRLKLAKRAVDLDPSCIHCISDYVGELLRIGRLDEAEALARSRMAMAPNGEVFLGEVYMARGDYDKAFEVFSDIAYEDMRLFYQARAVFAAGDLKRFERLKIEYSEKYGGPEQMARLSALEGDSESALAFLQLAFSTSTQMSGDVLWDPLFESLHGEPGWEQMRERAGLSEANIAGTKLNLPDGI